LPEREQRTDNINGNSRDLHDWVQTVFAIGAFFAAAAAAVFTGIGAYYTAKQWATADDTVKR
jgi:hypothetical protein